VSTWIASALITQAVPSTCVASHVSMIDVRSATAPCATGTPVLRIEVGTLASGTAARITGSAAAMTSAGVR
jgi:hypothetical protein